MAWSISRPPGGSKSVKRGGQGSTEIPLGPVVNILWFEAFKQAIIYCFGRRCPTIMSLWARWVDLHLHHEASDVFSSKRKKPGSRDGVCSETRVVGVKEVQGASLNCSSHQGGLFLTFVSAPDESSRLDLQRFGCLDHCSRWTPRLFSALLIFPARIFCLQFHLLLIQFWGFFFSLLK